MRSQVIFANGLMQQKKEAEGKFTPVDIPQGAPQLTYTPPMQPTLDAFNSKRLILIKMALMLQI